MTPTVSDSRSTILRALPIFASSSPDELARVDSIVDEIEVEPGEIVLRENEEGRESFIIISGTADVTLAGLTLTTLGPGDFFGEMAVLEGKPRTATVTARTPMHLLVVDGGDFETLLEQPGVAAHMLRTIVSRLREAQSIRPRDLVQRQDFEPLAEKPARIHVWRQPVRGSYPDPSTFQLSGYDQLRRFLNGENPLAPIVHLIGFEMEELTRERVVFSIPGADWFLSSQDHISVGALTMLADAAFGCAVMLGLDGMTPFSTSELSMTFLKPCPAGGKLRAIGTPVSDGRPLGISQAWIEDGTGERVAFGTSTCFIQPPVTEVVLPEYPDLTEPSDNGVPDPYLQPISGDTIRWDDWREMRGSEILARQISGELPQPPIHYLTGMTLREAADGRVTFTMPAHRWLTTAMRTVQGGAIAMLAHAALATAVTSTLEPGTAYRPVDVKVNFLRPVFATGTDLVATGIVTHRGRTLAVATADVVGPGGKKVATATGSTMILSDRA
jgi:CRP/FNR family cyclic AMP-dependent transcriptional regulator